MDSFIHHWSVKEVQINYQQQLDDGEAVEVVLMPMEEVREKLLQGGFQHPHTISALLLYFGKTIFEHKTR